jgi:Tfp pilus assembly protein PilN
MIEINLLPEDLRIAPQQGTKFNFANILEARYLKYVLAAAFALLICTHIFLLLLVLARGNQFHRLNSKWQSLAPQRELLEDFKKDFSGLAADMETVRKLSEQRILWAQKLNKISLSVPSGLWFNELSFSGRNFILSGSVLSLGRDEMTLINLLMNALKNDPKFFKDFQSLELTSEQKKAVGGYDISDFLLTGSLKVK